MKKLATIGLALTAMLALAAVAIAQYALPTTTLTGKVVPTKAGTKKKPANGSVEMEFKVNGRESNVTASEIEFLIDKDIRISGKGLPFCPATKIQNEGEASCPKGSKVGDGSAEALVGPNNTQFLFTITIYAASANEIAMQLKGPISKVLTGKITNASGEFGQKISVAIPPEVQQPIKGLYAKITRVKAKLGKKQGSVGRGKKKKKTNFVGIQGCGSKQHHLGVRLTFAPNPNPPAQGSDEARTTVKCKK
ncbi:MAG: hypothetical protein QOI64_207 [Solirubrobacteraceae bacterium]|nr:hypothetical protein [Solirubrobacteraceae bacterium]